PALALRSRGRNAVADPLADLLVAFRVHHQRVEGGNRLFGTPGVRRAFHPFGAMAPETSGRLCETAAALHRGKLRSKQRRPERERRQRKEHQKLEELLHKSNRAWDTGGHPTRRFGFMPAGRLVTSPRRRLLAGTSSRSSS